MGLYWFSKMVEGIFPIYKPMTKLNIDFLKL
jgi:hypothetical protein